MYGTIAVAGKFAEREGKTYMFLSINQLSKLYKGNKSLFRKYIKVNGVKYEDQKSLVDLIKFMEEN